MANRLQEIYDALREEGIVTTQIEFAKMLEVHRSTLCSAMNGNEKTLNPKIIARAEQLLKNIKDGCSSPSWDTNKTSAHSRKEIVIPPETMELYTNLSRTAAQLAETLDRVLNNGGTKKGAV